jgi:hypothetical protein
MRPDIRNNRPTTVEATVRVIHCDLIFGQFLLFLFSLICCHWTLIDGRHIGAIPGI